LGSIFRLSAREGETKMSENETIKDFLERWKEIVNQLPTTDMGSIEYASAQKELIQNMIEDYEESKIKQVSRTEVKFNYKSKKPNTKEKK
jgi:hypothetical protein